MPGPISSSSGGSAWAYPACPSTSSPARTVDCPDRRLTRASLELAAELADGETEVSMLLPRRSYGKTWRRILHDQTADQIVEVVSQVAHVNATIVPFVVATGIDQELELLEQPPMSPRKHAPSPVRAKGTNDPGVPGSTPISELRWRSKARIAGRVKSVRVQPWAESQSLECTIVDSSGHAATLVFLGRRSIAGIRSGTLVTAEGTVGKHRNKLAMINPLFEILSVVESSDGD